MSELENHLIARLPRKARAKLLKICEPIDLRPSAVLYEGGRSIRHVYFPTSGVISLVALIDGKPALEVSMVGREGAIGAQLLLGATQEPLKAIVQGSGKAWRIAGADFKGEIAQSPALQTSLNSYLHVCMMQLASSAACLRFHQIKPRLARWLLMNQDRAHADEFYFTHEFLASMLGVRRVGITESAIALQRQGLVSYSRGNITILNRTGLIAAACSCYGADSRMHSALSR